MTPHGSDLPLEAFERLTRIFFPLAREREAQLREKGGRVVYYTTAETAFSILKSKQIWLRNATLMNDFSEISHGFSCLSAAYASPLGEDFKAALDACFGGLAGEVEALFNSLLPNIRLDTFLTCISEHDRSEDARGRLSMWRAYGGSTGVALVFNGEVMHSSTNALGAFSSPVLYGGQIEFASAFETVVQNIKRECAFLRTIERQHLAQMVLQMLRFAVLCTKHPGFREELEWRVIASPSLISTPRLRLSTEVIRGVPQQVVKIDLEDAPDQGLTGLAIPALLDRVLIGPCSFPLVTAMAMSSILADTGIQNAATRVVIADIPLRNDL